MTTRYELIIIYWSKDDESFVVEVPELRGFLI
jgi:predicted RNase H-like HicB family nuclease